MTKNIKNKKPLVISFLGPDGSGKSTVIEGVIKEKLPFNGTSYFHLKPLHPARALGESVVVVDPHKYPPYSMLKSYVKLAFFIYQYNIGWIKNVLPLKKKGNLVIFDRYYHDLLVDNRRYRYGGNIKIAKFISKFIPKPDIFFVLTTDPKVIYTRKQEVPFNELERQVSAYQLLGKGQNFRNIDVNRQPEVIVNEVCAIINNY
ncbi:hypothetical protein LCGC14_0119140 [marine sediment metagenome]|uniref:Thymidylate kinase-like domain-containing protein n=1 Tax=marine sediment metagenome TaxID=412755 RepID=A0A0F9V7W6_9ZZZZ|nr:hypothetical protein [Maribacter sp.]